MKNMQTSQRENNTAENASALSHDEKYGVGEHYTFGTVLVEHFHSIPEKPSIVRVRLPGAGLMILSEAEVHTDDNGGMRINYMSTEEKPYTMSISPSGEVAFLYIPPSTMRVAEDGVKRTIKGQEYIQSTIEIEGTPEGVRVEITGKVDAAPRLISPQSRNSPLQFFLIEDNPQEPQKPVYHDIWAQNRAKAVLKTLKLVKDDAVKVIAYRHIIKTELQNHTTSTYIRHNLVTVLLINTKEGGRSAKRQKKDS